MTLIPTTVLGGSFPAVLPLATDSQEEIPCIVHSYEPWSPVNGFGYL